jgi:phage gpG-like protein
MPANVTVTRNFSPITEFITEADMREAGDMLLRRIRTRTENGVDVNGAAFAPYSDGYASQKSAELGHSRVDLTVSGRMLNDMHVTATTNRTATISFVSQGGGGSSGGTFIQRSRSMGAADKAAFNNPRREFFAASDEDEQAIADGLEKLLMKRLGLV